MATYAIVDAREIESDRFYVYALLDSSIQDSEYIFQPFYIGKGKGNRAWSHIREHLSAGCNPIKESRIKKIKSKGIEIKVGAWRYFDNEKNALQFESNLISKLGRINNGSGILTNLTLGGDGGTSGIPCSEEKKLAISKANTGKKRSSQYIEQLSQRMRGNSPWNKGKKLSTEYRKKLSESHRGRKQSPESVEARIKPLRGRKRPPEVVAKILATKAQRRAESDPADLKAKASEAAKRAWITRRANKEK